MKSSSCCLIKIFLPILITLIFNCLFAQNDWGTSGGCNWNVFHPTVRPNSSFDNETRSVFRFGRFQQVNGVFTFGPGSCTGTLLNQDDRSNGQLQQLFLTAEHCAEQTQNGSPIMFIFNYQSPIWFDEDVPFADTIRGDFLLNGRIIRGNDGIADTVLRPASSAQGVSIPGVNNRYRNFRYIHISTVERVGRWNDLAIMRIVEPIPAWFNVYYSGWNGLAPVIPPITTPLPLPGLTWDPMYGPAPFYLIHHPRGDIKKTSVQNDKINFQVGENYVASACWIVTIAIDAALNIFNIRRKGRRVNTKRICTFLEPPRFTTLWDLGTSEPGSSGGAFMNRNQRIVGSLHGAIDGDNRCNFPRNAIFVKFRNAFHSENHTIQVALNYSGNVGISLKGQGITCYNQATIQGELFPARDYQPQNHIRLQYENPLTVSQTTVYPGSDFHIVAPEIVLTPQTIIDTPDSFVLEASTAPCALHKAPPSASLREYYPDSSWYDPTVRQVFADSLCLTLAQLDSLLMGEMSLHLLNTVRNCQHVDIPAAEWEDQLDTAADSLCLSRAQLDSLLAGSVSQHMQNLIDNCPHLDPEAEEEAETRTFKPQIGPNEPAFLLYPNPHATSFTAALTLPEAQAVRLELLDLMGRRVLLLHEGELPAGRSQLTFSPDLPVGVYLCRIEAGGLRQHHQLVRTR